MIQKTRKTRMTGSRSAGNVVRTGCVLGLLVATGITTGGMAGCGGGGWGKRKEKTPDPGNEVDASLTALSKDSEPVMAVENGMDPDFGSTHDQVVESAKMMDEYFAAIDATARPENAVQEIQQPNTKPDAELPDEAGSQKNDPAIIQEIVTPDETEKTGDGGGGFSLAAAAAELEAESQPETSETPGASEASDLNQTPVAIDPEERKAELVGELIELLTGIARTSDNPGAAAATLAGLDSLSPKALDELYSDGVLSEAELSSLRAAQEVLTSISSSGTIASPEAVAKVLERVKNELDRQSGIRIVKSILCTRVDGFGKYEPFSSNDFIAGQAHEIIVYVEVDRFGWREMTGNDGQPRYEVELSQRLELYHVADDMNTWNRAAEVDRSVSRNRVRDYYLINKITLPANLGVGKYHLKVVMRDLVEDRVGESIVTIRMVAH